ncbi:PAS domain-containing protein [Virgibacillus halophilus]|uniref:PAS domain-containing protein n=1 Tax=Tigheibacillus halophilus TaxID=361280 RepID=A0ABU5CAU0_9BACI|nr:PAS domain-containing protein [Virgibacillus halophilus]
MEQIEGTNDDFHRQISTKQVLTLKELPAYILDWMEDNCCETVSIWDEDGYLLFISKSIKQILGIEREKFIGSHWSKLLTSLNKEEYAAIVEKLNNKENPVIEVNLLDHQKNYVWCECKIDKIVDPEHVKIYYIGIINDITDKKRNGKHDGQL